MVLKDEFATRAPEPHRGFGCFESRLELKPGQRLKALRRRRSVSAGGLRAESTEGYRRQSSSKSGAAGQAHEPGDRAA
jgi:hypothetical protein